VRLVHVDLQRLDELHMRQCALAIGPVSIEHGTQADGGEASGLVYVRLSDDDGGAARGYEGWFIDARRFPDAEAAPGRGAVFHAGTLTSLGLRSWPSERLGARIAVEVVAGSEDVPMALEVIGARRFTLTELRSAPPRARFQLLHGLRGQHAPLYGVETMEDAAALGVLYDYVDLGPGTDPSSLPPHVRTHKRSGLVHLRVRSRSNPHRSFEGWFWDKQRHPSTKATPRAGRLFLADTVTPTGVCLERARLKIEPGSRLPDAPALAAGFAQLGPHWRVVVAGRNTSGR
jgi:hypothetical protein